MQNLLCYYQKAWHKQSAFTWIHFRSEIKTSEGPFNHFVLITSLMCTESAVPPSFSLPPSFPSSFFFISFLLCTSSLLSPFFVKKFDSNAFQFFSDSINLKPFIMHPNFLQSLGCLLLLARQLSESPQSLLNFDFYFFNFYFNCV